MDENRTKSKKIPVCSGYIVVDPKKCCGCQTCMMICSLVHSGRINTKIGRIQVIQDPYGHYPDDIDVAQCRQCVNPACLKACPVPGAIFVDAENGNVIDLIVQQAIAEGKTAPIYHALTRPTTAEGEAVNRSIALAEMAGAPVYIVHLSSNDALEKVAEARDRGLPVYAETCPQYLFLSLERPFSVETT